MSLGNGFKFLAAIVAENNIEKFLLHGDIRNLFLMNEVDVYDCIANHVLNYGTLPKPETILQHTAVELPTFEEPSEYYLEEIRKRYIRKGLKDAVAAANEFLVGVYSDPHSALQALETRISALSVEQHKDQICDFKDAHEIVMKNYAAKNIAGDDWGIRLGWPTLDGMMGGARPGDIISYVGRPQKGKMARNSEPILKRDGSWTTHGEVSVGIELASIDGEPSVVEAVYPQGRKKVFSVNFTDGRSMDVGGEHLWEVMYREWKAPRVLTTDKISEMLTKKRYQNRLSIPLYRGKHGDSSELPLSPWLLGVLLGDGCFRGNSLTFSTADAELLARVREEVATYGCTVSHIANYDYRIYWGQRGCPSPHPLKEILRDLGLWGLCSHEKFIPSVYLDAEHKDRLELLRGLMDADGTVDKNSALSYCTTSVSLRDGFKFLGRSLGILVHHRVKSTTHRDAYIISLRTDKGAHYVGLKRKRDRCVTRQRQERLTIESVVPAGEDDCTCIQVSHPRHLYVGRDFLMTHNTFQMLYSALHTWSRQKKMPLFVSMEMEPILIMERLAAMVAKVPMSDLKHAQLESYAPGIGLDKLRNTLLSLKENQTPFPIISGNLSTTVDELQMLVKQFKPDVVFVDGAYLLGHPDKRMNRYQRVAENCEMLKKNIATACGVPVVASWQFAKTASTKNKKTEEVGLEDIGYSDVIAQISTVVLGLLEDETPENIIKKRIDILKGRNGETGVFHTNWDFYAMDFDEFVEPELNELQFI